MINQNLLLAADDQYQISRSLRFNSADSAYLSRTPASAGNRKTWTWSGWVKRSSGTSTSPGLFGCWSGAGNPRDAFQFNSSNALEYSANTGGSSWDVDLVTTQVFRDYSAWYHIVLAMDTTQATSSNRIKIYVNGSQVTAFGTATYPAQNTDMPINQAQLTYIGAVTAANYYDGYITEVNFIDGQALTPSSFGETDSATGVWKPKAYTGTYGTNGFYLKFADNSGTTSTTLGKDSSGNGNNWTPNNFSVTAGAGNDSLVDTPTPYGTDTGAGGEVRGNYCTWNPLAGTGSGVTGYGWTLANGNLDYTATNAGTYSNTMTSTFAVTSGKWYLEIAIGSSPASSHPIIGVIETEDISLATSTSNFQTATYISTVRVTDGQKSVFGSTSYASYGSSLAAGDILNIAIDGDNGKIWWGKNGTWFNSGVPASGTNAGDTFTPGQSLSVLCIAYNANGTHVLNAGQRPFAYTAPSGFKALCTQNLPTPTIGATSTTQAGKYFNPVLYTGSGATKSVTGVGFQPDLVWIRSRSNAEAHKLTDAVRGTTKSLDSASTAAEATDSTGLTAFGSDGFTLGSGANYNTNTYTYVAWNWIANGSGSSNTSGTITSTVSANTTAGFSIVTYTGTGANATVGHGLGVAPSMVIVKCRNTAGENWQVYSSSLTSAAYRLRLNTNDAQDSQPTMWNSTAPTSTVFSIGTASGVNANTQTYVAYCFAPVAGYSAFGSYTGNASTDGPFVYTGFRPRYLMAKRTDAINASWVVLDSSRDTYNPETSALFPNLSSEENAGYLVDFLSNGFKVRNTGTGTNASGGTYIYAAFAESPFKYSLAR